MLYLDTSALVKPYVGETGAEHVELWIAMAPRVLTALVTYAEARAAFAQVHRTGRITASAWRAIVRRFDEHWHRYGIVTIDESLVHRAAILAERHRLRAYDAIQLAAALESRATRGVLVFGSFDERLNRAAVREGLALPPEPDVVAERPRVVVGRRRAG